MVKFDDLKLDPGISHPVKVLMDNGIVTFESCQGGDGHAYKTPTICFEGDQTEGYKVVTIMAQNNFRVIGIRRCWPVENNEIGCPYWELELSEEGQPILV